MTVAPPYGSPQQPQIRLNAGHTLACYEWGRPEDPALLLGHATGFHGRCWDQVVASLPTVFRVFAYDMRGHGASDQTESYGWDEFGSGIRRVPVPSPRGSSARR